MCHLARIWCVGFAQLWGTSFCTSLLAWTTHLARGITWIICQHICQHCGSTILIQIKWDKRLVIDSRNVRGECLGLEKKPFQWWVPKLSWGNLQWKKLGTSSNGSFLTKKGVSFELFCLKNLRFFSRCIFKSNTSMLWFLDHRPAVAPHRLDTTFPLVHGLVEAVTQLDCRSGCQNQNLHFISCYHMNVIIYHVQKHTRHENRKRVSEEIVLQSWLAEVADRISSPTLTARCHHRRAAVLRRPHSGRFLSLPTC